MWLFGIRKSHNRSVRKLQKTLKQKASLYGLGLCEGGATQETDGPMVPVRFMQEFIIFEKLIPLPLALIKVQVITHGHRKVWRYSDAIFYNPHNAGFTDFTDYADYQLFEDRVIHGIVDADEFGAVGVPMSIEEYTKG